jgi:nitroreductase
LLIEAGHVGQNIVLAGSALGIGSVPLGGFVDTDLARLLQVDIEREIVLYAIAVGVAASESRETLRWPDVAATGQGTGTEPES